MPLVYGLSTAASTAADVAIHRIKEIVNDGAPRMFDGHDGDELKYERNDTISLTQKDIDSSGNEGVESDPFVFVAHDSIAPPKAGQPGVTLIREEP